MKCVVFDAEGMIIKGGYFSERYSREHCIDHNTMLPFFQGPFKKCLVGETDLKDALLPYLTQWKWDGTVEEFIQYWLNHGTVDEEIVSYIKELRQRGICCILTTNNERHRTEHFRTSLGLNEVFDLIIASCDVGSVKPTPQYLKALLSDVESLHPNASIMVWDDNKSTVDKMKRFGLEAHVYTDLDNFKKSMERVL